MSQSQELPETKSISEIIEQIMSNRQKREWTNENELKSLDSQAIIASQKREIEEQGKDIDYLEEVIGKLLEKMERDSKSKKGVLRQKNDDVQKQLIAVISEMEQLRRERDFLLEKLKKEEGRSSGKEMVPVMQDKSDLEHSENNGEIVQVGKVQLPKLPDIYGYEYRKPIEGGGNATIQFFTQLQLGEIRDSVSLADILKSYEKGEFGFLRIEELAKLRMPLHSTIEGMQERALEWFKQRRMDEGLRYPITSSGEEFLDIFEYGNKKLMCIGAEKDANGLDTAGIYCYEMGKNQRGLVICDMPRTEILKNPQVFDELVSMANGQIYRIANDGIEKADMSSSIKPEKPRASESGSNTHQERLPKKELKEDWFGDIVAEERSKQVASEQILRIPPSLEIRLTNEDLKYAELDNPLQPKELDTTAHKYEVTETFGEMKFTYMVYLKEKLNFAKMRQMMFVLIF